MSTVKLTIDNRQVEAPVGATILEAARAAGIKIPTLCAWPEIKHTPTFDTTGGVMEAALRTVYAVVTGEDLPNLDITPVRGLNDVKKASVKVGALGNVKIAVARDLGNARKLTDKIREGKADYAFIEVMCCPGGCISGGSEPISTNNNLRVKRSAVLYKDDGSVQKKRQSHENESVKKLYDKFLKKPLGHKSHELLHIRYINRKKSLS